MKHKAAVELIALAFRSVAGTLHAQDHEAREYERIVLVGIRSTRMRVSERVFSRRVNRMPVTAQHEMSIPGAMEISYGGFLARPAI